MTKTMIVGIFNTGQEAERAKDLLKDSNFSPSDIEILKGDSEDSGIKALFDRSSSPEDAEEFFLKKGLSKPDAQLYAQNIKRDDALLIFTFDKIDGVDPVELLNSTNAKEIYEHIPEDIKRSQFGGDRATMDASMQHESRPMASTESKSSKEKLQVVEEELHTDKQQILIGGVQAQTVVSEEQVQQEIPLKEQHVEVHRQAVDREAQPNETLFQEQSIEATEYYEEPVVSKKARVIEEIYLDKSTDQRTETINETVRRQDVDIQELGLEGGTQDYAQDFDHSFRQHHHQNYAGRDDYSYDDYLLGYRYGTELAQHPRYQHQDFTTIENEARRKWEERNSGTWDQFKDAIRYGFDKLRGDESRSPMQPGSPPAE